MISTSRLYRSFEKDEALQAGVVILWLERMFSWEGQVLATLTTAESPLVRVMECLACDRHSGRGLTIHWLEQSGEIRFLSVVFRLNVDRARTLRKFLTRRFLSQHGPTQPLGLTESLWSQGWGDYVVPTADMGAAFGSNHTPYDASLVGGRAMGFSRILLPPRAT